MAHQPTDSAVDQCRRCGTCCKKGGPALHVEDRELVESGRIPLRDLYTIRRGEMVRDEIRGTLQPADGEIIKIKAHRAGSWTCRFFDEPDSRCRIYADRPIECSAMQCWDTRHIERIYDAGRLRRKDLVGQVEGLWELIETHERRCGYENLAQLALRLKSQPNRTDAENLLEMIQYDFELRKLLVAKEGLEAEMLDFLLGRPLSETTGQFGIRLKVEGGKITRLAFGQSKIFEKRAARG